QNIYTLLGDAPPADLARPISKRVQRPVHTTPRALLQVKIDGRLTFFEWVHAGVYTAHNERGTMAQAMWGPVREGHFGFDLQALLVRVDFDGPARRALAEFTALRVRFLEPEGFDVWVTWPADRPARAGLRRAGGPADAPEVPVEVGLDKILEMAVPFDALGVRVGEPVQFFLEVLEGGQSRDRAPREG